ncbi:MAG: ATP-binding cassette domain-containing protein [Christensenellales bacterium]|jgi:ABC-2 type transport system ATP-binding protein
MSGAIELKGIGKNYGSVKALEDVTLTFMPSTIYGLLGRNGAGKTTLLNIIADRVFKDTGELIFSGEQQGAFSERSGIFMVSESSLYPEAMRVRDVFRWTKEFYPSFDLEKAGRLSERFALNTKSKVKALSTGYGSILKNIVALCLDVPYILLDEPVLGLDANHRELFYRLLIEKYNEKPATYIISTHIIEEIQNIIERVVIIDKGRIIKDESCADLMGMGYTITGAKGAVDEYVKGRDVIGQRQIGGIKTAYIMGNAPDAAPQWLEIGRPDLQTLFIQLTGETEVD